MKVCATLLLAALLVFPAAAAAQSEQRPIRQGEIAASGAATVYEAIEKLRPDWLWAGGDPADSAMAAQTLVYVDGRRVGTLHALRGIRADGILSVRAASPARVRTMDPKAPPGFQLAVLIATEPTGSRAPGAQRGFEVSLGVGMRGLLESRMTAALRDYGWRPIAYERRWATGDRANPLTFQGSVGYNFSPRLGVAVVYQQTGDALVRGVPPTDSIYGHRGITNTFSAREAAALVLTRAGLFRAGVGAAYRDVRYTQIRGTCVCFDERSDNVAAVGGAGELGMEFPIARRFFARGAVSARYYPSHEIPAYQLAPAMDVGGLTLLGGISLGFRP